MFNVFGMTPMFAQAGLSGSGNPTYANINGRGIMTSILWYTSTSDNANVDLVIVIDGVQVLRHNNTFTGDSPVIYHPFYRFNSNLLVYGDYHDGNRSSSCKIMYLLA